MPPRRRYPPPHEQLYELALIAREVGLTFPTFWDAAMQPRRSPPVTWSTPFEERPALAVVWPRDTEDRNTTRNAILESRDGWARAYDRLEPSPAELALVRVAPAILDLVAFPR